MNISILDHLHAFLNRELSRLPAGESEPEMTTEEHAALRKALNPKYRVHLRQESGRVVDVAWSEEGKEEIMDQCTRKP